MSELRYESFTSGQCEQRDKSIPAVKNSGEPLKTLRSSNRFGSTTVGESNKSLYGHGVIDTIPRCNEASRQRAQIAGAALVDDLHNE